MLKVLFVENEQSDKAALQLALENAGRDWTLASCSSSQDALNLLAGSEFDVVLFDGSLTDSPPADFCRSLRDKQPNCVRIVTCRNREQEFALRGNVSAHYFLSVPIKESELISAVVRACSLKEFTRSKNVLKVVSQVKRLPTLPQNYQKINEILQREDVSIADIAHIINQDVAMVAKILQLANSAVFGGRKKPVSTAMSGVKLLGVDNLKLLVLAVEVFSQLDSTACENFNVEALWEHCMRVGGSAQRIARTLSEDRNFISDSMTAGTLHDLGKLVLINHFPQEFNRAIRLMETEGASQLEAEQSVFGTTHAEIGGYLLGSWSLPQPIVEAVAYHHQPLSCARQELSPLLAVYAANELSKFEQKEVAQTALTNDNYLKALNVADRVGAWWELTAEADSHK